MRLHTLAAAALALTLTAAFPAYAAPRVSQTAQAVAPATADQAKPFVGDWVATLDAPQGPATVNITVALEGAKVVATVNNEMMGSTKVTNITMQDKTLVLHYTMDMMGNTAPVVVSLTPDGAKLKSAFSFMDGQFEMGGSAERKK